MLSAVVTSTADTTDPGTLRSAILFVNAESSPDTITFNIPGTGVQSIALTSALPAVTNSVTIDGTSQPGYAGSPLIELNGAGAGAGVNGLELDAANSMVKGLVINRFSGDGILIPSGGSDTIQGNYIGTDPTGAIAEGNGTGIVVSSGNNVIGGVTANSLNVISGNINDGIDVSGNGNLLEGNYIGTNAAGTETFDNTLKPLQGNVGNGITVFNASNTTIGGTSAAARNIISGNNTGVAFTNIAASQTGNVVEGNYIGLGLDSSGAGTVAAGNLLDGVDLVAATGFTVTGVVVGGTAPGAGNVISANLGSGIYLNGSFGNFVQGNFIGTDSSGNAAIVSGFATLGNGGDGITIDVGAYGNTIGGPALAAGNVISGNGGNGITVSSGPGAADNLLENNVIGLDATGLADGNSGDGIRVVSGTVTIGAAGAGNVVSANLGFGIALEAGGAHVMGNFIGTDGAGRSLGNAQDGVFVKSSMNFIGNSFAPAGNTIAFNGTGGTGAGVFIQSGTGNDLRDNSIYSNRTLGIALGTRTAPVQNDSIAHAGGPNLYQNFPVITSATGTSASLTISGTLSSSTLPNTTFVLDFFSNTVSDPSGYGQGRTYIGSATVTTDSSGMASFTANFTGTFAAPMILSATATDPAGNTSEFGMDVAAMFASGSATMLSSSADPSSFGQSVTYTATITGPGAAPTGTVTFSEGSNVLATSPVTVVNGMNVASFMSAALGVGDHTIVATYSGDSTHASSASSLTQTVNRAATSTTLASSADPSMAGQSVTFTATVAAAVLGSMPTGTVMFMDGGNVIGTSPLGANGTATLTTSALVVGDHMITAMYNSDSNFAGSQSAAFDQTVNAAAGTISGHTYFDTTGDGQLKNAKVMGGITVQLLRDTDGHSLPDSTEVVVATTVSDSNTGGFSFTSLANGVYFVQEITPSGYVRTAPSTTAYYTDTITTGTVIGGNDFDNFQQCPCKNDISHVEYIIDGNWSHPLTDLRGHVHQGDTVEVQFTVNSGHTDMFSLVSYTAPGSSFSASTASQQRIYQDSSAVFGPGVHTLTVLVPPCYFQVDFVCGAAIDQLGPAGSNIFYSAQGRLISADNGGTHAYIPPH